ncbi:SPASM domain-containing protein [Bradyrhizobium sp. BR 10261]|nr:SPASM domain-containing protein [Bradyrhizobium sp. BR 10261]
MNTRYVPINKGNYSMDTAERQAEFDRKLGGAWPQGYAEYRRAWSENPTSETVTDYPLLVDIELSSICNLKCPMCYTITQAFKEHVNVKRMDWALIQKIIDEIGGKVPAIRLSLRGEATLNKNFAECIRYAKAKGIKEVSTLTHGFKLTVPYFAEIAAAGIDWITISIDGVGETYERIRSPIGFEELLQKIRDIKRYKDEHGLDRPVIKVQGIWPAIKENPQLYYETFAPLVDLVAFNPLIDYLGRDDETDIYYVDGFTCPQQYQRLVIGADGLVMKCSNDEENREVIGDVKTQSVHEIWHGPQMQAVRDMQRRRNGFMESPVCRKCYLPRRTVDEETTIDGRKITVRNYVNRPQVIGK